MVIIALRSLIRPLLMAPILVLSTSGLVLAAENAPAAPDVAKEGTPAPAPEMLPTAPETATSTAQAEAYLKRLIETLRTDDSYKVSNNWSEA